ncbi:MAG: PilZ domain-containing protein [Saccharospirillum sp.]
MDTDRRDYFRVNDMAYLSAQPFNAERPAIEDYFPQLHQIAVLREFERVNQEVQELQERIKDAAVRKMMTLFNEKLDLMTRYLHITDIKDQHLDAQMIDIGEGGCACQLAQDFSVGDELALAVIFTPSYVSLFCRAKVVEVSVDAHGRHHHLAFLSLPESQRQALTRHMFKVQARNRQDKGVPK